MTDLVAGRYPVSEEEWLLDGSPVPPYRRTVSRRDIASGSAGLTVGTTQVLSVFPVPVQAGDIFNFASFLIAVAGATLAHSWVAIYNGTATGAALLAQVTDNTTATGWAVGAQKLTLTSTINDIGQPGTPQGPPGGPGSWSLTAAAPALWGIGIYQSGTTLNKFDAMPGSGAANGAVAVAGQAPMATFSAGLGAIATAPAVLPTMTPANGPVPYVLLSRQ
jgi:hypothetical protein